MIARFMFFYKPGVTLSAIISKEWIEEAEANSSIIQIYRRPKILLCSIGDAVPQETFYNPRVGVNVMSKTLANHIASEEPLTSLWTKPIAAIEE